MAGITSAVRDALASVSRSFKRVSVYRHAVEDHAGYMEPAVSELDALLTRQDAITLVIEPTALLFDGEVVHTEPARETGLCFRLYRDGVRTLTFRRGVTLDELLTLAHVTMVDAQAESDHEDAVTELWKADLEHVEYGAGTGYRMDEAGENVTGSIGIVASLAQSMLTRHLGDSFKDSTLPPPLWSEEQRSRADPRDYSVLARRALLTILKIVEQEYAGWDLEALQDSFTRQCSQLLDRGQARLLAQPLDRLRRMGGSHAAVFREAVGTWLVDPMRLERAVKEVDATARPQLLGAWLQLLPAASGPEVLALLPQGRNAAARLQIAEAALARIDTCVAQVTEILQRGRALEVEALLAAMAPLPASRRGELATAAFENRDPAVKLLAIPLVAADAMTAVRTLGPSLSSNAREVRIAAVRALGGCSSAAEQAATLILEAMDKPPFSKANREERSHFFRALGKLGTNAGFKYLLERLNLPRRKIFGRRKGVEIQLLAVEGLSEDPSPRSARALEEAQLASRRHPPSVVAACKKAAEQVRARGRSM